MYLHQPPAEEGRDEQSETVEGHARDLSVRPGLPVVREKVDTTSSLGRQGGKSAVENLGVELKRRELVLRGA